MTMAKELNPFAITVSKGPSNTSPSAILYIKESAADILLQYPRQELMYMTEEGDEEDEDGEYPDRCFIAVVPESSPSEGRIMTRDKKRNGAYRSAVPAEKFPLGTYIMSQHPEHIDGIDWFELTPEIQ
jgi:hypothetical protein